MTAQPTGGLAEGRGRPDRPDRPDRSRARVLDIGRRSRWATRRAVDLRGFRTAHLLVSIDVLAWAAAALVLGRMGVGFVATLVIFVTLNAFGGLYVPKLNHSVLDEVPSLVARALAAGAVVTSVRVLAQEEVGSRIIHVAVLMVVFAALGRGAAYALIRRWRRGGLVAHPTLIVGAGHVGGYVAEILHRHPEYGLRPVGFLDGDPLLRGDERSLPVLGNADELAVVLHRFGIRNVVVAFSADRESAFVDILRTCDRFACEIFYVPRLYELGARGASEDQLWSLPLVRLPRATFRSYTWKLKRVFDVAAAALALVALAPVLIGCAVAVRWKIGPVLFRQHRVGLDGREFELLKFRTLTPVDDGESASHWNIADDRRLTKVGHFLRSTALDELPQLVNILRGDMSIVGPRPERPFFVQQFTDRFPRYMSRHRVPAGLTGWAQIHGLRGDTSIEDRARFDNYYIENWSLWLDVKIILRTLGQVVRAEGG